MLFANSSSSAPSTAAIGISSSLHHPGSLSSNINPDNPSSSGSTPQSGSGFGSGPGFGSGIGHSGAGSNKSLEPDLFPASSSKLGYNAGNSVLSSPIDGSGSSNHSTEPSSWHSSASISHHEQAGLQSRSTSTSASLHDGDRSSAGFSTSSAGGSSRSSVEGGGGGRGTGGSISSSTSMSSPQTMSPGDSSYHDLHQLSHGGIFGKKQETAAAYSRNPNNSSGKMADTTSHTEQSSSLEFGNGGRSRDNTGGGGGSPEAGIASARNSSNSKSYSNSNSNSNSSRTRSSSASSSSNYSSPPFFRNQSSAAASSSSYSGAADAAKQQSGTRGSSAYTSSGPGQQVMSAAPSGSGATAYGSAYGSGSGSGPGASSGSNTVNSTSTSGMLGSSSSSSQDDDRHWNKARGQQDQYIATSNSSHNSNTKYHSSSSASSSSMNTIVPQRSAADSTALAGAASCSHTLPSVSAKRDSARNSDVRSVVDNCGGHSSVSAREYDSRSNSNASAGAAIVSDHLQSNISSSGRASSYRSPQSSLAHGHSPGNNAPPQQQQQSAAADSGAGCPPELSPAQMQSLIGDRDTGREASSPPRPPSPPHLDLATYPPQDLLRVLAALLQQIAMANDQLRPSGGSRSVSGGSGGGSGAKGGSRKETGGSGSGPGSDDDDSRRCSTKMTGSSRNREGEKERVQHASSTSTGHGGGDTSDGYGERTQDQAGQHAAPGDNSPHRDTYVSPRCGSSSMEVRKTHTGRRSYYGDPEPYSPGSGRLRITSAALGALGTPSSTLCFHARNVPSISIESYLLRILKYCPTTNEVFLSLLVYFDRMSRMGLGADAGSAPSGAAAGQPHSTLDAFEGNNSSERQQQQQQGGGSEEMRRSASTNTTSSVASGFRDASVPHGADQPSSEPHPGMRGFAIDSFNVHRLVIAGVTVASKFFSDVFYTNSRYAKVGGLPVHELNQLELQFLLLNDFKLVIPLDEMQRYADQLLLYGSGQQAASASSPSLNSSVSSLGSKVVGASGGGSRILHSSCIPDRSDAGTPISNIHSPAIAGGPGGAMSPGFADDGGSGRGSRAGSGFRIDADGDARMRGSY